MIALLPTVASDPFDDLRAQFQKPQFMTTSSGPASIPGHMKYSLEFSFVGDCGDEAIAARDARDRLHDAIKKAAASPLSLIQPQDAVREALTTICADPAPDDHDPWNSGYNCALDKVRQALAITPAGKDEQ